MRVQRPVLTRLALVPLLAIALLATMGAGCFPDTMEIGVLPMTTQRGAANADRGGLDVHDSQASWVEAGVSGTGPVKYVAPDDTVYTIATAAMNSWTAIGGGFSNNTPFVDRPLVAYRTDTSGVHIVNPLTSVEETFLAGITPDDFGQVWVAYQEGFGGAKYLRAVDIRNGTVYTFDDVSGADHFDNVRIEDSAISWSHGGVVFSAPVAGGPGISSPAVGSDVTIDRVWSADVYALSWTERDNVTGYCKIYHRPVGTSVVTEVLSGGKSKQMGGFDGNYVTWFEDYGTSAVRTRAVAVEGWIIHDAGDQLTYTGYDPIAFAWDFETFLWQQRSTNKLFLTRIHAVPPRVKGSNRFETLANMAKLRVELQSSSAVPEDRTSESALKAIAASPLGATSGKASFDATWGIDVVVAAGYDNASPDAIVAPGLCGVYGGPLLLVNYKSVPAVTAEAISAARVANGGKVNIHVVGGTAAVSKACYNQLSALKGTGTIDRVGGHDSFQTAEKVAYRMKSVLSSRGDTMPAEAIILNGSDHKTWDDAASIGVISAGQHIPVLFVKKYSIPSHTKTALSKLRLSHRYVVGGTRTASDRVMRLLKVAKHDRIKGRDRYATSMAVVKWGQANRWLTPGSVFIAGHLHEALGAGAFNIISIDTGMRAAYSPECTPVVLSPPRSMSSELEAYLRGLHASADHNPYYIHLLIGGEYSVGAPVVLRLLEIDPYWYPGY